MKNIFVVISILLTSIFALNLKKECLNEINLYPNAAKYVLRFETYFDDYGCDLLPLYNVLDKVQKEYILDYIDEHQNTLPYLIKLSKKYPNFLKILANNDDFINFLKQVQYDKNFFNNVLYLLKFISLSKIYQNKNYLKYIYFAAYKASSPQEAYKSYLALKKIPIDFLNSLIASYLILKTQFPTIGKNKIINDFIKLKYQLTYKELKLLCKYNPEYLISFLYNVKYVDNFNTYQKEMIFIYKRLFEKYSYNDEQVLTLIVNIAPYLIEQKVDFTPTFKKIFTDFINYDLLSILITNENGIVDPCRKNNYFGIFSNNNLKKLIIFANQENQLYIKYMQDVTYFKGDSRYKIFNLIALANLYHLYYGTDEWKMIKGILLSNLFSNNFKNMVNKVNLVLALEEINYFQILANTNDWNKFVRSDSEDKNSKNTPKYLYILFTSAEAQNTTPFLKILLNNPEKAKNLLDKLANYSIEELAEHRFTTIEKTEYYIDTTDNIVTGIEFVVAIALGPETGGASLAAFAAMKSLQTVGKKTLKKVAFTEIKKITKKYFSKQALKYYTKKYTRNYYKKYYLKKISNNLENVSDTVGMFALGFSSIKLFLNGVQFKQLCKENR